MKYVLRDYQKQASDAAVKAFQSTKKTNGLIIVSTGGGKSLIIADIASRLDSPLLVFQPSKEILQQNFAKLQSYGILDCGCYSASVGCKDINRITFATIGSVMNHMEDFKHFKYVLIDEVHVVNSKGGMYEKFINSQDRQVVGLTATPYRLSSYMGGSMLKFLTRTRPRIFSEVLYVCQTSDLLAKGYLADLKYYDLTAINMDNVRSNSTGADYDEKSLKMEYERSGFFDKLTTTTLRVLKPKSGIPRKGVLVFTRFVEEAESLVEKLKIKGISAAIVTGATTKAERESILQDFKNGIVKVVANVGTLTTGFDYPELDTVILGRPTKSLALYYQMCLDMKTEILTKRGFLKYSEISKDDKVAAYHGGKIVFTSIEDIVHRQTYEGEPFVSFCNSHLDFRVTGEHDLLVKSRGSVCDYKKEKAQDVMERNGMIIVPVSGIEYTEGLPLTDDEICFLGWVISDGNVNKHNNAIHIVQSVKNEDNIKEIEMVLKNIGLRYSKILAKRKGEFAKYADTYHFIVSYGMPRRKSDRLIGLTGWSKYEKYIIGCKQWNDNLDKMNEAQFEVFINSIYRADGDHRIAIDYQAKSFAISCGTFKDYADRLQSLALRRGWRCNQTEYIATNGGTQYLLHFKKLTYCTIAGNSVKDGAVGGKKPYKRARIQAELSKGEYVWCVKDKFGTIVTRRNGKVLIMGNCGRAIRPFKDKDGWVIDLAGNYKRFGKVSDLKIDVEKPHSQLWCVKSNGKILTNRMF
ncbi:intein N-terminal splicing region [Prevotella sp. KH2C16]|nr:intein N-terminal splicing region [Prevotella sp. KH2C16]